MTVRFVALHLVGSLLPLGGLAAQDRGDPVRIDDYALPAAATQVRMDQLTADDAPVDAPAVRPDRSLIAPPQHEEIDVATDQVAGGADQGALDQLSGPQQSRPQGVAGVSSKADSAPGSVVRIGGRDRCDPRMGEQQMARCLEILELRASEFQAPAPPQLSAEQTILAEQRESEESLADRSINLRFRYATMSEPDADLQSNQELASIYLADQPRPVVPNSEAPAAQEATQLETILGALGLEAPPPQGQ